MGLLAIVTVGLSFLTGALKADTVSWGWRLSAYDTAGTRRLALTLSLAERPDITLFDSAGQRWEAKPGDLKRL